VKLNPARLLKNPVIFVVEVGAVVTTLLLARDFATGAGLAGSNTNNSLTVAGRVTLHPPPTTSIAAAAARRSNARRVAIMVCAPTGRAARRR